MRPVLGASLTQKPRPALAGRSQVLRKSAELWAGTGLRAGRGPGQGEAPFLPPTEREGCRGHGRCPSQSRSRRRTARPWSSGPTCELWASSHFEGSRSTFLQVRGSPAPLPLQPARPPPPCSNRPRGHRRGALGLLRSPLPSEAGLQTRGGGGKGERAPSSASSDTLFPLKPV